MRKIFRYGATAAAIAVAASAAVTGIGAAQTSAANSAGDVFAISNEVAGNRVLAFDLSPQGTLAPVGSVATDGLGTGSGLGSQGSVIVSGDLLFAVNPGSNEISSLAITKSGLVLQDVVASGGVRPTSVTEHDGLLYVLNAGGTGNIHGFTVTDDGDLEPIAGSLRPLSSDAAAAAQISFSPDGGTLVVTERMTNVISTYAVEADGTATGPDAQAASGVTPFGFSFDKRGNIVVSEAFGGAPDASAVSSYDLDADGDVSVVTASSATTETAACWIAITKNGRFAYASNTGSGTVSGYAIGIDGSLTPLDSDGVTAVTGPGSSPADSAISANGQYLLIVGGGTDTISVFRIGGDGSLTPASTLTGLPATALGLAVR